MTTKLDDLLQTLISNEESLKNECIEILKKKKEFDFTDKFRKPQILDSEREASGRIVYRNVTITKLFTSSEGDLKVSLDNNKEMNVVIFDAKEVFGIVDAIQYNSKIPEIVLDDGRAF
jgi:hypothetical protein